MLPCAEDDRPMIITTFLDSPTRRSSTVANVIVPYFLGSASQANYTMGNSWSLASPSAGSAGIDVPELADLVYERSLGSGRFMKSIRARHHDGVVLAKVTVKPSQDTTLQDYRNKILGMR